ncbi:MAG: TonB-dependent receptor [Bacteroidota bacterium]
MIRPALILTLVASLGLPVAAQHGDHAAHAEHGSHDVAGRVVDAATGEGVPFASVRVRGTSRGTAADVQGRFQLRVLHGDAELLVSAVGFAPERVDLAQVMNARAMDGPLVVRLAPQDAALDAVLVSGERAVAGDPAASGRTPATTDDLLARLSGVGMIQRANFAWEPVVRGYQGGQIALTVDGMPVYGACVDKMDPASSYVEPENLAAVEVAKGAADLSRGSQIGGAVNLVTERPAFGVLAAEAETGVESQGAARRVRGAANVGGERWALRASGSYRAADDYAPGGAERVATSGYEKRNIAVAGALRLGDGHRLSAQVIADDAWLVGYPALLMDATLAQARIASLDYEGRAPGLDRLRLRLYRNRVEHTMDDRFRDVMERPVMRGMYMPMAGYTDVWGGQAEAGRLLGRTDLALTADVHRVRQFGDMFMFSLFPGIRDMVLLNVGDARALNGAVTLEARRALGDRWAVTASARLDATARDTHRDEIRQLFASRYGAGDLARNLLVPSLSATATYALSPRTRLRLSLADAGRLPTIVEQYGHYVYNYVDGYFYTGRPDLKPERSRQLEVGVAHAGDVLAVEAAAFGHLLQDVVVGVADSEVVPGLSGSTYRFRLYDNAERGWMAGGELSALADLGGLVPGLAASASVSATFGQNVSFGEPLPLIPPVSGLVALRYDRAAWSAEAESRWALAQNRVAFEAFEELPTDGYNVLALRFGWEPAGRVSVEAGAENLFDTFYRDHLALSDLAARGRSLYLSLGFNL